MASLFSKDKRIILVRRITGFWDEFKRKKIGLFGVALLIFFVVMAALAPWLTPYDPLLQPQLAQSFALPEWITLFPGNADLPKTRVIQVNWQVEQGTQFVRGWGDPVNILYEAKAIRPSTVSVSSKFTYDKDPPNQFIIRFAWSVTSIKDTQYSFTLSITTPPTQENPTGKTYRLMTEPTTATSKNRDVYLSSINDELAQSLQLNPEDVARTVFSQRGEYTLLFVMEFIPTSQTATASARIANTQLTILGRVWGILGTDYLGWDVFTQVVWGARMSLVVGLIAALVGTLIGIFVGIISGYLGGIVDEISMRVVDVLLCLPFLPLLLALIHLYGRNVYYIVLFIAIFGWQGLARLIRSQILSLRETTFIESAKASGAGSFYIMIRHLLPNVLPVAFASMVLAVPSAIMFEATLSFLNFGDPRVPTWGKMLQYAYQFGGFTRLAWWWILPPGLAIVGICLAFVFMGHALDEVVNPRLRRRR